MPVSNLSPAGRRYDRSQPAPLPLHRMLRRRLQSSFPMAVDLLASCGPVKDQGNEGACTAHAGASSNEWIHRRYLLKSPIFSPQYTYARELLAQGNFPEDSGSDGVTLCNTLIANGCCELSEYLYVPGQILKPTPAQDTNAAGFRLGAYHGIADSNTALSVLGDPTPWPVLIGFTVYPSFESDETAETGIMLMPKPGETPLGGHEVVDCCGYDVGQIPTLRPAKCPPALLIQNSWGSNWGINGRVWMPIPVLDLPDTDMKIAHSGEPWR